MLVSRKQCGIDLFPQNETLTVAYLDTLLDWTFEWITDGPVFIWEKVCSTSWMRSSLLQHQAVKLALRIPLGTDTNIQLPSRSGEHNRMVHEFTFTEIEWNLTEINSSWSGIFPNTHFWNCSTNFRKMAVIGFKLEQFEDRIIFMLMYTDVDWSKGEETSRSVFRSLRISRLTQKDFQ